MCKGPLLKVIYLVTKTWSKLFSEFSQKNEIHRSRKYQKPRTASGYPQRTSEHACYPATRELFFSILEPYIRQPVKVASSLILFALEKHVKIILMKHFNVGLQRQGLKQNELPSLPGRRGLAVKFQFASKKLIKISKSGSRNNFLFQFCQTNSRLIEEQPQLKLQLKNCNQFI